MVGFWPKPSSEWQTALFAISSQRRELSGLFSCRHWAHSWGLHPHDLIISLRSHLLIPSHWDWVGDLNSPQCILKNVCLIVRTVLGPGNMFSIDAVVHVLEGSLRSFLLPSGHIARAGFKCISTTTTKIPRFNLEAVEATIPFSNSIPQIQASLPPHSHYSIFCVFISCIEVSQPLRSLAELHSLGARSP